MVHDPLSPVPRNRQFQSLIRKLTQFGTVDTSNFVSMDDFKEMKEIEKAFGSLNLNPDEEMVVKKQTTQQPSIDPTNAVKNTYWTVIAD